MECYSLLAVGVGAAAGAWLRWGLGILFNPVFPTIPLGTLAANLIGGYLMGVVMVFFDINSSLPPEVRLAVTTGFLGGLTTFSTFSGEAVTLLARKEFLWSIVLILGHVAGSLGMTAFGILTVKMIYHISW